PWVKPAVTLSARYNRHYPAATASEAISPVETRDSAATATQPTTAPLYTFHSLSEQEALFVEMRHHRVSWRAIGEYFGKSSLEVFYGYIPLATTAYKHKWSSRMTERDVWHHLSRY
ncbi:hypothetical protein BGX29_009397, partial [Mortierella sp. GBA35]